MKNSLLNWTPRPPMTAAASVTGKYVRVDPFSFEQDVPQLWNALGGNADAVNDRLKWYGLKSLGDSADLGELLQGLDQQEGWGVNVMRLVPSDEVAGMASYISTSPQHGSTEIGYVAHGLGMARTPAATEAHYLLAKHAIDTMGYRRYEWKCDSQNQPSRNAALRLGFQYEGCFRQHFVTASDTNRDTCWFSMLDGPEWLQRKQEFEAWLDSSNFDGEGNQLKRLEQIRQELVDEK